MTMASDVPSSLPVQSKDFEQSSYSLQILQQPRAARACGPATRDRRVIDPPIILKLVEKDPDLTTRDIGLGGGYFFTVTCKLCRANGEEYKTLASEFEIPMRPENRPMLGENVCNGFIIDDEGDQNGCYFWFSDLSIRPIGDFRIEFTAVKIRAMNKRGRHPEVGTTLSNVFRVHSTKDFKGYEECTVLTTWLRSKGAIFARAQGKKNQGDEVGDHGTPSSNRELLEYVNQ